MLIFQVVDEFLEHHWDWVFSTKEKLGGNVRGRAFYTAYCVCNELSNVGRDVLFLQLLMNVFPCRNVANKLLNHACVGSDLLHSLEIELIVGNVTSAAQIFISFLAEDNFVNEPSGKEILWGPPNFVHTGEISLQLLDEDHEIPNSKNVIFHEDSNIFIAFDEGIVDGMGEQGLLQGVNDVIENSLHFFPF